MERKPQRRRPSRNLALNNPQSNLSKEEIQNKIDENKDYQKEETSIKDTLNKYAEQGIYSLSDASEKRNLEAVKYFLIHINDFYWGRTLDEWLGALYEAVKNRYLEIIDYLLENDKEGDYIYCKRINYSHSSFSDSSYFKDCYPCELHIASKMGYIDIVKRLVEYNNICEEEYNKSISTRRSFKSNHVSIEEYINLKDREGNTALLYAVQNNHIDIADYLIQKGSKLTVVIHENRAEPCEHECYDSEYCSSYTEIRYYDVDYYYNVSLLFKTYRNITSSMLELLMKSGLNINDDGYKGKTVLDKAYEGNNAEIVKLLIEHRAISLKDKDNGEEDFKPIHNTTGKTTL